MKEKFNIKINFRGGIISPGELYNILVAASRASVREVSFGLRQQLLIDVPAETAYILTGELEKLKVLHESDTDEFPNITSSYAAEDIFIQNTWLSEGLYKDIFDTMDWRPRLKINISDANQSFTPLLTGNINWVASATAQHFWHLFIRFPKTNTVYEWDSMVYTNDLAKLSREIEQLIFQNKDAYYGNPNASGDLLFRGIQAGRFITKPVQEPAVLPAFNLPYYEGLNRYNNKYWLGIYRRDEMFQVSFLKELCLLCLDCKIGQFCSTPWKSIIVKGIEEKDKPSWNRLLEKHQINMRHAANELNFQVEDNCTEGLRLKNHLVKGLNKEDTRTFGLCIGIKTRKKSEVFCNILVRRKPLLTIFGVGFFHVYDILYARNFNPNERTGFVFSKNNPRFLLSELLRRSILSFYATRSNEQKVVSREILTASEIKKTEEFVSQCRHCLTVYDVSEIAGVEDSCSLCGAPSEDFIQVGKTYLGLHAV